MKNELYKIILVDDEDEVRGRISSKILKESGFEVVGTAGNGYDALELIEKFSPHVVMTDIKMPYIDGIELARIIRRDYPTVRIGFITGYDEFDYAREAIKLNVYTYLTKPLTQEDITAFLRALKEDLDSEFAENYNRELIRKRYEESIPLVIENTLISLLASTPNVAGMGALTALNADIEQLRLNGVSLDETRYLVSSVLVERDSEQWGIIEFEKLKLSVRARLSSLFAQESFECYHFMFNECIVFIVKEKGSDFSKEIDIIFNRMIRTTEHFLSVLIDIGVSTLRRGFGELAAAYEESWAALSYSRFCSENRIFYFSNSEQGKSAPVAFKESNSKTMDHVLRYGSEQEMHDFLSEMRTEAELHTGSPATLNLYVLNLVNLLANFAASIGSDITELAGEDIITLMAKVRNMDQLFSWVASLVKKLRERTIVSRTNNAQKMLEQAINEMYRDFGNPNLTIDTVCDRLGISASYLGQLFRKYKDTTFVKFLTFIRMEKAKERLVSSGDRIVEIAAECGYQDVYYFSHSFKKYTLLPPKKYREEHA